MGPRRQPSTLYTTCLKVLNVQIHEACKNIQKEHGTFDKLWTPFQCERVRKWLVQNLPNEVLDDLCAVSSPPQSDLHEIEDHRIRLDIFLHQNTRRIHPSLCNFTSKFLDSSDSFWKEHFSRLTRLVSVTFPPFCLDDAKLVSLAANCPLIREIICQNVPPKPSAPNICMTKLTAATVLKLEKCVHLNMLILPETACSRSECSCFVSNREEMERTMIVLLQRLKFKHVCFPGFSDIIVDHFRRLPPLGLEAMYIENPEPVHVIALNESCRRLSELRVVGSSDIQWNRRFVLPEVFTALSKSSLDIYHLDVEDLVEFDDNFYNFLTIKGHHLTKLELVAHFDFDEGMHSVDLDASKLIAIAKTCPNLETLSVIEMNTTTFELSVTIPLKYERYFAKLRHLQIWGIWNTGVIIPLCLDHALNIRYIDFRCFEFTENSANCDIGYTMDGIIRSNPFQKLEFIKIYDNLRVSWKTITYLLTDCPNLQNFLLYNDREHRDKVMELVEKLRRSNFHVPTFTNDRHVYLESTR